MKQRDISEQSNPLGEYPPHTYGVPRYLAASFNKRWCKEYRKTNSTGTVQHLYTSIPVGGTAGRFDLLYWNLRRRGAGNAYRNLCRQWSDDPLWTSGAVYVHQFPILAEPFLWIWTMVRKKGGCISRPERRSDEKS